MCLLINPPSQMSQKTARLRQFPIDIDARAARAGLSITFKLKSRMATART